MIDDERGRIPFAMVGVVLLVGAAAVAVTTGPGDPTQDPAVESVLDRTTATVNSELRDAATSGAEDAASAPLIEPANNSWGTVVNESHPFRDSLRIRIYDELGSRLDRIERTRDDVRAGASLPQTPNATALGDAIERVSIDRLAGNETAVTVGIENVTLTVERDDRTVATRDISPEVTVSTPVLEMHDRVETYEDKLDAGITEPGLTQRLTAQITAIAWARGWAQNRGAPIDNVVANHHVEVATNAAALDVQRTTIGHVDPNGVDRLAFAAGTAAGQDVVAATGSNVSGLQRATDDVARDIRRPGSTPIEVFDPPTVPAGPDDSNTVGVNRTADDEYVAYVDTGLNETIEDVYTAEARLLVDVEDHAGGPPSPPASPGQGWTQERNDHRTDVAVGNGSGRPPGGSDEWRVVDEYVREVEIDHQRVRVWEGFNETRRTRTSGSESATVEISLQVAYGREDPFWDREVDGLYEDGAGPLSGPNLAGIDDLSRERLVAGRGGPESIAVAAVTGSVDESPVEITGEQPEGIVPWIREDLNDLREELRDVRVENDRDDVASFEANQAGDLARRLGDGRHEQVDPPERFDGVADRARIAARATYHRWVNNTMNERATDHTDRAGEVGDHLGNGMSTSDLQNHTGTSPRRESARLPALHGPDGPVRLRVDAAPSYLSLAPIDESDFHGANGTEHPLVAQNLNVFSVPIDDIADAVGNATFDYDDQSRLDTAARALRVAESTLDEEYDPALARNRTALRAFVQQANRHVESELAEQLLTEYVEDRSAADEVVETGLQRWDTTHGRALVLSNGSAADPIADAAIDRAGLSRHEADLLRLRIDRFVRSAVEDSAVKPPAILTNGTATVASNVSEAVFDRAVEEMDVSSVDVDPAEAFSQVPNGIPLAPIPGSWYATTNIWTVSVEGEYVRFGVRTTRAGPNAPGGDVGYMRDGGNVTIDVTDDGVGEHFGESARVNFEASAGTAVLVPPGPNGVGDVEGDRNETSAGWPNAGPK